MAGEAVENPIHPDLREILLTAEQIRRRVQELGAELSRDYAGQHLHLVCVLRGGLVFLADLIRELTIPASIDFIAVSSYGSGRTSSGIVRIVKDLEDAIEDRCVLLVEDIVDSGRSLAYLVEWLHSRKPSSLEVCTLLDKPAGRKVEFRARYVGFTIPDEFVVGYGLDYNQQYRGLPYVGVLRPEAYGSG